MSQTVKTSNLEAKPGGAAADLQRHPFGLYALFATEMWERFGFYTVAAIMTLYLQRGGFGWTRDSATNLWSYYLMFVYATPLVGGWLADRYLGYRRSVLLGGLLFLTGYLLLGLGSVATFYPALALIFAGNGFFKPNVSTMVGNLYPAGSRLKDSAYNIFYMGINVGALLAPIVAEGLLQLLAGGDVLEAAKAGQTLTADQAANLRSGFLAAFYAAAIGMTIGTLLISGLYRKLSAVERRRAPALHDAAELAPHRGSCAGRREVGDRPGARVESDRRAAGRSTGSSSSSGWSSTKMAAR